MFWSAAISNLAQLYFGGGPNFGGLSGVIYALVGYLWARGRFDPRSGIALPNRMVGFFMVWLALGFTGLLTELVGRIANYCHLGGFAAGVLYGYIAARIAVRRA
jgi:GlpG protein